MKWRAREHAASIVVASLSAAFGAALIQGTSFLAAIISGDELAERSTVQLALAMVGGVFFIIAVYVASLVTVNTFATVIAGRTKVIALLRLIGSTGAAQRRAVAREGLVVGIVGTVIGTVVGAVLSSAGIRIAAGMGIVPELEYALVEPFVAAPALVVVASTWAAAWIGAKRVAEVSPMAATGTAIEAPPEQLRLRPVRKAVALLLGIGGGLVLVAGIVLGLVTPLGFLVAFVGGLASFSGIVAGGAVLIAPLLALIGRALGDSAPARLATASSTQHAERNARTTIGLVIGVGLVTTFAVAAQGYTDMILAAQAQSPGSYGNGADELVVVTVSVFSALIGFSALIAAFGMINSLSLSVLQRTREIGLLRALGFTRAQVRAMIVAESVQITVTAIVAGVGLGIVYGWAGAQSLLGSVEGSPGLVWPSVPWMLMLVLAVSAALVTLAAAQAPARRATRIAPVAALAAD